MSASTLFSPSVHRLAAGCALAAAALGAQAQAVPGIGNMLQQVQPPALAQQPAAAPPSLGNLQSELPMERLPGGQAKVKVERFEVTGNRVIAGNTLLAQIVAPRGRALTLDDLEDAAAQITRYYRNQGYFVARAYVPAQEVTNGTVVLRVLEGNYGDFHVKNDSRVRSGVVQGMLDAAKNGDAVSVDGLERAMLIVNDTPGVQVTRADVVPGTQVGAADFAIETQGTKAVDGYVVADNHGSRFTGSKRVSAGVGVNSPTGSGDRLAASGLISDSGDLANGRVAYSIPVASNGLRAEVAASQTEYQLADTWSHLDARGTAQAVDATLTYPVRRTRAQTINASASVSYKNLLDEIRSTATRTPKRLGSLTLGISVRDEREWFGLAGVTQANAAITAGSVSIRDDTALAFDQAGARIDGGFAKLVIGASRVNLLPGGFQVTASARMQQSLNGKNLDSSERMTVSGPGGVSAYPSGELIGTNAMVARLELARALPAMGGLRLSWNAYADWGMARAARPLAESEQRRSIGDVGLGLDAAYLGGLLRAALAHRLDAAEPESEPYARTKLLVQAGWIF